jgi:hypothetical protein
VITTNAMPVSGESASKNELNAINPPAEILTFEMECHMTFHVDAMHTQEDWQLKFWKCKAMTSSWCKKTSRSCTKTFNPCLPWNTQAWLWENPDRFPRRTNRGIFPAHHPFSPY